MALREALTNIPVVGSEWRRVRAAKQEASRYASSQLREDWCACSLTDLIKWERDYNAKLTETLGNRPQSAGTPGQQGKTGVR